MLLYFRSKHCNAMVKETVVSLPHLFHITTSCSNHSLKSRIECFTHGTQTHLFLQNQRLFLAQFCLQSIERSIKGNAPVPHLQYVSNRKIPTVWDWGFLRAIHPCLWTMEYFSECKESTAVRLCWVLLEFSRSALKVIIRPRKQYSF